VAERPKGRFQSFFSSYFEISSQSSFQIMSDQVNNMQTISRTVSSAQLFSPRQSPRRPRSSIVQTPKSSLSSIATSSPLASSRIRVNSYKRSWVLAHFKSITVDAHIRHVCQVELPTGDVCGAHIIPDKSSSTKGLIRHLKSFHPELNS
jgi:hypothetical protein